MLTDEEIVRLVRIGVEQLGIREVRFTGGEPLLRPGLVGIVAAATALSPRPEVSLTTNSIGLARVAPALAAAGLDRINCSLDTVDPSASRAHPPRPARRRPRRPRAAQAAGLTPVKVNAVLLRGINEEDALPLLDFCLEHGYELRFIEQMPLDAHHAGPAARWSPPRTSSSSCRPRTPYADSESAVRRRPRLLVDGGPATVGVIASVTRNFCGACDRTRLTADGQIRNCLFAREESDLRRRCARARPTRSLPTAGGSPPWPSCRARHRRPELPAAQPADVGDRRLSASSA